MATKTFDVKEDETKLNELLSLALEGTEVILTKNNTPLARLIPVEKASSKSRVAGLHKDAIWISEDFDAPLNDDFWLGTE